QRGLRLKRRHGLLAPRRLAPPSGDAAHAGRITADRPDLIRERDRTPRHSDHGAGSRRGREGRHTMKGLTYDAGASAYDSFTGRWSLAFAPGLLTAAGVTVGQTVLEVAAGTGGLTVRAVSVVGPSGRVVATDLSLPMLRVAKAKIAGLRVELVAMDGQRLACR